MSKIRGGFTLPGESGYEKLTLKMADKWGADVIRDSDGTVLSDEILNAGYGIYSTICIIRDHNKWARQNTDKLQQTFLMTNPKVAVSDIISFDLLADFFSEQFKINDSKDSLKYWQVYDRTANEEVSKENYIYDKSNNTVTIKNVMPFHKYTVSFLAYRIWEEISMYNHTTNNWDREHLMQIDPMYLETRVYMKEWMENWCQTHPDTTVVRFTSMFYNFVWIWGSDKRNPYLFSDWASYDFTVSPLALDLFAKRYGYQMTAEDFVNGGKLHVTHSPATPHKLDWMDFINEFVVNFGKELVDIVHRYNKKAYVFYDDSWVGVEPYHQRFKQFGFDGLIKCVFSGFEARLCAGVDVAVHELRLHPYLFPVGLGGVPTFTQNGNPTLDAKKYWNSVRRALLREKIDRIGLGGYLHLVENYPDFCDYIEKISDEFRQISSLHDGEKPVTLKQRVAVLHYWGKIRSWSLSGHFHETYMHDLIHINESLSGMPFQVSFINFEDIKNGVLKDIDVLINAGKRNSAWSGGDLWNDSEVIEKITKWVYEGGAFIGVNEPSATNSESDTTFKLAHILGVDKDLGERVSHGRWSFDIAEEKELIPIGSYVNYKPNIYLTDGKAKVLMAKKGIPTMTSYDFGKGRSIYLSSYEHTSENTRMLLNIILYAAKDSLIQEAITDNPYTECAYFKESKTVIIINNSDKVQNTKVSIEGKIITAMIEPYDTKILSDIDF